MDLFKLRDFAAGAGIDVGAGPDSLAVAVVKHNPFAHGTAGDGLNIGRLKVRICQRLADTLAGQQPVGGEVKLHRAGNIFHAQVLPFRLTDRDLVAAEIENHRPNTAGPGI